MFDSAPYSPAEGGSEAPGILFSVKGGRPGPRLVVSGASPALREAAEELWKLGELVTMRGSLELREGRIYDFGGYADDMMHLGEGETSPHLRILGRMTALGMVTGRGIPIRFVA